MKKYILVSIISILSCITLLGQDSTKVRYDIFSVDAINLYSSAKNLGNPIAFQVNYERMFGTYTSFFLSQNVVYDATNQSIFTHTVIGQRNYFVKDLKGFYIGPYTSFNLVQKTITSNNIIIEEEVFPVLGIGGAFGLAFNYKKLHLDIGAGIGIGHPLKDGYYQEEYFRDDDILGIGKILNTSTQLLNFGLKVIPSYINMNIGFRKLRKPKPRDF